MIAASLDLSGRFCIVGLLVSAAILAMLAVQCFSGARVRTAQERRIAAGLVLWAGALVATALVLWPRAPAPLVALLWRVLSPA